MTVDAGKINFDLRHILEVHTTMIFCVMFWDVAYDFVAYVLSEIQRAA